jgi:NAD(P)-dependent dehydrogenase (short-subunit alcohol dehydrogenase family)
MNTSNLTAAIASVAVILSVSLSAMADELKQEGAPGAMGQGCDVSEEAQVAALTAKTLERWKAFHVVVNNAGLMIFKPLEEQTSEDWRKILSVDLLGAFYFIKQAFLHMPRGGTIILSWLIHG